MTRDVIIADDNAPLLRMWALMLRREGHEVRAAVDGFAALTMLQARRPDVLVVDYAMPKMTGLDVVKELRKVDREKQTRCIVITGMYNSSDFTEMILQTADFLLAKPFEPRQLISLVEMLPTKPKTIRLDENLLDSL